MRPEELKHSTIYQALKSNKSAQEAFVRMGKTEDWKTLKLFVAELKQLLLEATLEIDNIEELKRYKYLINGFESIALLPELVKDVKQLTKDEEEEKRQKDEDSKRRKFNPGGIVNRVSSWRGGN